MKSQNKTTHIPLKDFEVINGAYYCRTHKAKNCVTCFSQGESEDWEEEFNKEFFTYEEWGEYELFKTFIKKLLTRERNRMRKIHREETKKMIEKLNEDNKIRVQNAYSNGLRDALEIE